VWIAIAAVLAFGAYSVTGLGSGGNDHALVPVESKGDQPEFNYDAWKVEENQPEFNYDAWKVEENQFGLFSYDDWKARERQSGSFSYDDWKAWERLAPVNRTIESLFLAMTEDELALRCAEASTHEGEFASGWEQQAIEDGKEEWAAYGDYAEASVLQRCTNAGY